MRSLKAIEDKIEEDIETVAANPTESKETKSFTQSHAISIIKEFAESRVSQTEKMIFGSRCELNGNTFEFKLQNKVKFDRFYELKQEFLDFLRKKLENYEIQAEAIITTEQSKAKPRTEQEKFEIMAAKNPNLHKLKDELGLDLIF